MEISNELRKRFLSQWKGSGVYDNEEYTLIKREKNCPKYIGGGTCWIGDRDTFNDIIEDYLA